MIFGAQEGAHLITIIKLNCFHAIFVGPDLKRGGFNSIAAAAASTTDEVVTILGKCFETIWPKRLRELS